MNQSAIEQSGLLLRKYDTENKRGFNLPVLLSVCKLLPKMPVDFRLPVIGRAMR